MNALEIIQVIGFFLFLFCLFGVGYVVGYINHRNNTEDYLQELKKEQRLFKKQEDAEIAKLKKQMINLKETVAIDCLKTKTQICKNKTDIQIALINLRKVYRDNQRNYHINNKKIYKIVSKTSVQEYEAIDNLLKEFNSLD